MIRIFDDLLGTNLLECMLTTLFIFLPVSATHLPDFIP